ncbi:hypothetical protein ElyMa_006494200 [Elysia marginata]|uniref:TM2 domain-containing protein n=1 Tax=Elysia marginata TaxID=1093978 RepID=A0AAV4I5X9_9GAST|nr:hypothetical protein ElyMa_006494200 [Elysia marginata]
MKKLHKKDPTQPLPEQISLVDAYLTWFPLGIFGLHHLYLKRPTWAVIYLATFGLFLAGWIVDAFWMVSLVREANHKLTDPGEIARRKEKIECKKRLKKQKDETTIVQEDTTVEETVKTEPESKDQIEAGSAKGAEADEHKSATGPGATAAVTVTPRGPEARAAVALAFSVLGLFGAHHYYLKRTRWGVLYTCTLGLLGIGRRKWGIIYLLSVGVFGIGWLMDGVRLPFLLKETNAARVAHQSTEEPDIDTNITPPADDYDDDNNSLAINFPDNSNKHEEAGTTTMTGGGDTQRTTTTVKDIISPRPNLNVPETNTPKAEQDVNSPKDAGTQQESNAEQAL